MVVLLIMLYKLVLLSFKSVEKTYHSYKSIKFFGRGDLAILAVIVTTAGTVNKLVKDLINEVFACI